MKALRLTKISIVLVGVVGVVGCSKKNDAAKSEISPGCMKAGETIGKLATSLTAGDGTPNDEAVQRAAKIAARIAKHCQEDQWSAEAIECVNTSQNPKADCTEKLTSAQFEALRKDGAEPIQVPLDQLQTP